MGHGWRHTFGTPKGLRWVQDGALNIQSAPVTRLIDQLIGLCSEKAPASKIRAFTLKFEWHLKTYL